MTFWTSYLCPCSHKNGLRGCFAVIHTLPLLMVLCRCGCRCLSKPPSSCTRLFLDQDVDLLWWRVLSSGGGRVLSSYLSVAYISGYQAQHVFPPNPLISVKQYLREIWYEIMLQQITQIAVNPQFWWRNNIVMTKDVKINCIISFGPSSFFDY